LLWLKALHLIFMVTWFAGLFYLPRLFVYHAMSDDPISIERFKVMERKLCYGIMTPGGILTLVFGLWLLFSGWTYYSQMGWVHAKLAVIALMVAYHIWCFKLVKAFRDDHNPHTHVWYRWFNEVPVLFLVAIILLATLKPF
jgi:putative membrane protein